MSEQYSLAEIVNRIEQETGLSKEEIYTKINERVAEYNGSVTELGAAYLLAKDLGVELTQKKEVIIPPKIFLGDLVPDMDNITVEGRVIRIYDYVRFNRKDGSEGIFIACIIQDNTGNARVIFWDQSAYYFSQSKCKIGDGIRIIGAYTKEGKNNKVELHVGNKAHIQFRPSDLDENSLPSFQLTTTKISHIKETDKDIAIIAQVTKIEDITFFERSDGTKGKLQKVSVADDTGEIQIIFWNEKVDQLKQIQEGDLLEIIGLNAKKGIHGYLELHSTKFTKIEKKLKTKEITIKRGYIRAEIDQDSIEMPISQVIPNQTISIKGLVVSINPVKEFTRNDGTPGKVRNLWITDKTGAIRVVLWDSQADKIDEQQQGKLILIKNAFVKKGRYGDLEINCGSQVIVETEEIKESQIGEYIPECTLISEISENEEYVNISGEVVDIYPIRSIVTKNDETVELRSFKIQDSTKTIFASCWRDNINKISNLQQGDRILIINAMVKTSKDYGISLNIVSKTIITKITQAKNIGNLDFLSANDVFAKEKQQKQLLSIEEVEIGREVIIEGTVVKIIETAYLSDRCPTCNRKLEKEEDTYRCIEHGIIDEPVHKLFIPIVINDGTGSITVICTGKVAEKLLKLNVDQAVQLVNQQKSHLALYARLVALDYNQKDLRISGKVNFNQYFNKKEILAKEIVEVNYREAINSVI
ncbi:MAG: OB-fold nucleic acid binding domain-containing protein [Candidatus Heimdallarchaeaceae archaeon]